MILDLHGLCSTPHGKPQLSVHMPGWLQRYVGGAKGIFLSRAFFPQMLQNAAKGFVLLCFSPQMLEREEVSKSCDVYSYGVLLFEIATLQVPFRGVLPLLVPAMTMDGKVGTVRI